MKLGLGIGWRPELASFILGRDDLGFVEVVAESLAPDRPLPVMLDLLLRRNVAVVPHGVRLSLGSAEGPAARRVAHLAACADRLHAPVVSEHVAFVRAGGREAGHLLPLPRSREALAVLVRNVKAVQQDLSVPLALEPIAALLEWPDTELTEGQFLTELLERTDARLLLDVANVYANSRNRNGDPGHLLDALPLERVAYVHVAGGVERGGYWHDTHAHPVPPPVLELLADLAGRVSLPGVLLERDDDFPPERELHDEMGRIAAAVPGLTRERAVQ